MQKLKCLSPIKVKVRYVWEGKKDSDIWLFDFSGENEVHFGIQRPAIWRRGILFLKGGFYRVWSVEKNAADFCVPTFFSFLMCWA